MEGLGPYLAISGLPIYCKFSSYCTHTNIHYIPASPNMDGDCIRLHFFFLSENYFSFKVIMRAVWLVLNNEG